MSKPAAPALEDRWRAACAALGQASASAPSSDPLALADALWLARVIEPAGETAAMPPAAAGDPATNAPSQPLTAAAGSGGRARRPAHGTDRDTDRAATATEAGPDGAEAQDSLFIPQRTVTTDGSPGPAGLRARRVHVPAAEALPGRVALERALKPFLRRRPSRTQRRLDPLATALASAQATADALAAAGGPLRAAAPGGLALVPVFSPVRERWFDVALLVEDDEAMQAFDDTARAWVQLLGRHGAFGQVQRWQWTLETVETAETAETVKAAGQAGHRSPGSSAPTGAARLRLRSPRGLPAAPRAALACRASPLVLVLTHGASPAWQQAPLAEGLQALARHAVVAVLQLLPPRAWPHTALGEAHARVVSPRSGAPTDTLQVLHPFTGRPTPAGPAAHALIPMLPLQADALAGWARHVMGPRRRAQSAVRVPAPARAAPSGAAAVRPDPAAGGGPAGASDAVAARLAAFRASASPAAFALLRRLAAAPVTLPVMRLLQHTLPPPHEPQVLAEVLLSGLLRSFPDPPGAGRPPPAERVYEFAAGVREWLHGSLSQAERREADAALAAAREQIRQHVEARTGRTRASFAALLLDPGGTEVLSPSAQAFVDVSRRLRALQGLPDPAPVDTPRRGVLGSGMPPSKSGARRSSPGQDAAGVEPSLSPALERDEARPLKTPRKLAEPGTVHGAPPLAQTLVDRSALVASLAARLLALPRGRVLTLSTVAGAGARTVLAQVVRTDEVRQRFAGGVWWGREPPRWRNGEPEGDRLVVRPALGGARLRRSAATALVLVTGEGEAVDIGLLSPEEAIRHLVAMGVDRAAASRLQGRHGGLPALVPLVGFLHLREPSADARVGGRSAAPAFPRLAGRVWRACTPAEQEGLLQLAVRHAGHPDLGVDASAEAVARQLGWRVPGAPGESATLHPSVTHWLLESEPEGAAIAHHRLLADLCERLPRRSPAEAMPKAVPDAQARGAAYLARHALDHLGRLGTTDALFHWLYRRPLAALLLDRQPVALQEAIDRLPRDDARWRDVQRLSADRDAAAARGNEALDDPDGPAGPQADRLRQPLAPAWPWGRWTETVGAPVPIDDRPGRGIRVALLSTGVAADHPELQHLQFIDSPLLAGPPLRDRQGHGTAVASVIAGRYVGLAPGVRLQSLVALDDQGRGTTTTMIQALSALLSTPPAQRADILCVPMGLGAGGAAPRPLQDLVQAVLDAGIVIVAAAGNEPDAGLVFPASWPGVLSVGALASPTQAASFSASGPLLNPDGGAGGETGPLLWAPGVDVLVAVPGPDGAQGGAGTRTAPDASPDAAGLAALPARYARVSGTSFACAVVAALAARHAVRSGERGPALARRVLAAADERRAR